MMDKQQKIGIAGLGLMGRGIAACLLSRGFRVVGFTIGEDSKQAARQHIAGAIQQLVERAGYPSDLLSNWPSRVIMVDALAELAECDFVIESVLEDLQIKRDVYDQLEAVVGAHVPIASNTSGLPITLLQQGRRHPQRFIGMHWCEPCHITWFLEIIRGEQTDDATVEATMKLGVLAGKDPSLVRKDVEGFIINRLAYAVYREAFWLLENGVADVETIDRTFRNVMPIWCNIAGPFRWMDLTGIAAYASVMERLWPKLSCSTQVPMKMRELVTNGTLGISTGRGFYEYTSQEADRWRRVLDENVWMIREMTGRLFGSNGEHSHDGSGIAAPSARGSEPA